MQFSNTISYSSDEQLVPLLLDALASEPESLSPMEQYMLSWEAASERLLDAAALPAGTPRAGKSITSYLCYALHYAMGTQPIFDVFRIVTGAGPVTPWNEQLLKPFSKLKQSR